ncbi:MAG: lipoate--protein ligase family protein [Thermoprotei archaeon]|nr:MAG: lipoate--protein ligase family protein [Thermoprotei archaeon]
MSRAWRLIILEPVDCYTRCAIDEALLKSVGECRSPNTLRFLSIKPPSVSIGYFQRIEEVVNVEECRRLGISIARRPSGGGAIYQDYRGEITYAIVVKAQDELIKGLDIEETYKKLLQWLIRSLRKLGLNAQYKPPNDITINGRKVSGNAQSRKYGAILQHGTILLRTYKNIMAKVLKTDREKLKRVTGIEEELRREIDRKKFIELLIGSFEETYSVRLVKGSFTDYELKLIEKLRKKYSDPKWIYKR